jgi:Beta-lactamase enzyme family
MGGWTRTTSRAAAGVALAFLVASCSSPGTPININKSPTGGFSSSSAASPHPSPSRSTHTAVVKPKLADPFKAPGMVSLLTGRTGQVTAALYDKRTNQTWVYHRGVLEYTASIVKVEIMGTLLHRAQTTGQPLTSTEQSELNAMIEVSDNNAASSLLDDVGGPPAVQQFDNLAGLTDTTPHATAPPIPGTPWPAWGLTSTTARDQVALVKRFVFPNKVLTGASRAQGLTLMKSVEVGQNWGVSGGVLPGTTVALKNGWIQFPDALPDATVPGGWQINSIGWIKGHGRDYVLAVLTNNDSSEQYGIDTIQDISQQVFTALAPHA